MFLVEEQILQNFGYQFAIEVVLGSQGIAIKCTTAFFCFYSGSLYVNLCLFTNSITQMWACLQ